MGNSKCEIKDAKHGKGCFATQAISKDEIIFEFEGPILHYGDDQEYKYWTQELEDHAVQVGEHVWISNNGIGQYINHSCEPNCGIKNLVQVVAMRDIKKGEELRYDYGMTENSDWRMQCACESTSCRITVGSYGNMPQKLRDKYRGYISEWLLR